MKNNIKKALVKNIRDLATNLRGLSDIQLEERFDEIKSFIELLTKVVQNLENDKPLLSFGISDSEIELNDELATVQAELNELKFKYDALESSVKSEARSSAMYEMIIKDIAGVQAELHEIKISLNKPAKSNG